MFEDSEEKEERGDVVIVSDTHETPFQETTREGINDLLDGGYEVDDDKITAPENKPIPTGNTDRPLYKGGYKWSDIDYSRASGCQ